MSTEVIIMIRKYGKHSNPYKKQITDYARKQEYKITQTICIKDHTPLIYANGKSLILHQLVEAQVPILLVYSFQHLSRNPEELLQFMDVLIGVGIQCYAVLERMYLHEIRQFLLSPYR